MPFAGARMGLQARNKHFVSHYAFGGLQALFGAFGNGGLNGRYAPPFCQGGEFAN